MSSNYSRFLLSACFPAIIFASSVSLSSDALAGFEWTPPERSAGAVSAPVPSPAPEPVVVKEQAPIDIIALPEEVAVPVQSSAPVEKIEIPAVAVEAPEVREVVAPIPKPAEPITWNEVESYEVIEGFGSDMPLVLALRQIVPAHYAFSFGDGVQPGTIVSWQGDKPWNEVLSAVLEPLGAGYRIHDNIVSLQTLSSLSQSQQSRVSKPAVMSVQKFPDEVLAYPIDRDIAVEDFAPVDNIGITPVPARNSVGVHQQSSDISVPADQIESSVLQEKAVEIIEVEKEIGFTPIDIISLEEEKASAAPKIIPRVEDIDVKRTKISDPGEFETHQPHSSHNLEIDALLKKKKR